MFKNKDTRSALSGSALPAAGASQFAGGVRTAGAVLPAGNARTTGVKPAAMRSGNRGAGQNFGGALGGAPLGGVPAAGLQGAPQHSGGVFAEMVCSWLEKVRFRKKAFRRCGRTRRVAQDQRAQRTLRTGPCRRTCPLRCAAWRGRAPTCAPCAAATSASIAASAGLCCAWDAASLQGRGARAAADPRSRSARARAAVGVSHAAR